MSCTISAGTPAPRCCVRTRRTRMSSAATSSSRRSAPRASTSSIPNPIRCSPTSSRRSSPRRWPSGPATPRATPSTAAPTASTSAPSARLTAMDRAASSCSITTPSTSSAAGRSTAATQYLHYDFWWHLGYDTMVSSEWGTPNMVETGVQPELLLDGQYGHRLHFWDLRSGATCRRSTSARSTRSPSSCGRRTTRPEPTASSTPSSV